MWERGCFSTTTLAPPRRPCRPRHLYAVPRTSPQCVCTWRRNCIEQLSPSSPKYAPGIAHFPARNSAIIKLTRYPAVSIHSRFVRTLGNPCAPAQTAAGRDRACDLRLSRCTGDLLLPWHRCSSFQVLWPLYHRSVRKYGLVQL
jgi:hypothetical protein